MGAHDDDVYVISDTDVLSARPSRSVSGATAAGTLPIAEPVIDTGGPRVPGARAGDLPRVALGKPTRVPIAASLSLFVCGSGQAYNGQWKLGTLFLLIELLAVAVHWSLLRSWTLVQEVAYLFGIRESEILIGLAAADFLLVVFLLCNVMQAYQRAEARCVPFEGVGIPVISAMASGIVPGWGQILNGQIGKGLFFLFGLLTGLYAAGLVFLYPLSAGMIDQELLSIAGGSERMIALGLGFAGGLLWMLSVYDAFLVARYRRDLI